MSDDVLSLLTVRFADITIRPSNDMAAFNVPASDLTAVCQYLRDELKFDLLVDVTAVDWQEQSPRFTTMYHLCSTTRREALCRT